jgi:hypothetical protein
VTGQPVHPNPKENEKINREEDGGNGQSQDPGSGMNIPDLIFENLV